MRAVIQRVTRASVCVDQAPVATIKLGILALLAVHKDDCESDAERLVERILNYRIFADHEDRMNLSLRDIEGELLLVPQFTLAANTQKGNRPSFTPAAPPERGQQLFQHTLNLATSLWPRTQSGRFGADMQVSLCNDGPVTFILETR